LSFRDREQQTEEPCEATSLTHGFEGGGGQATDLPKPTRWTGSWERTDARSHGCATDGVSASRREANPLCSAGEPNVAVQQLTLLGVDDTFAVCKLAGDSPIPPWATASDFFSITRTADELSVVCRQDAVPEGIICERGWRTLRVAGAMPFAVVGVLAALTAPLAEAGIGVFAISTFDTDYLLVKGDELQRAVDVLRQYGHLVHNK
jgi:hypothetical protein